MPPKKLKFIKIIEKRPVLQLDFCERIVKIFKIQGLKITVEDARHLWDLHGRDNGVGWITKVNRTDIDIFEAFQPYYIVDAT